MKIDAVLGDIVKEVYREGFKDGVDLIVKHIQEHLDTEDESSSPMSKALTDVKALMKHIISKWEEEKEEDAPS